MRPKVATFDCYGTLVDWEGGLGGFLYTLMLREGVEDPPPGRELRERWEAIQFEVDPGDYKTYKEVLGESVLAWCREFGVPDRDVYPAALVGLDARVAAVPRHSPRAASAFEKQECGSRSCRTPTATSSATR